MADTVTRRTRCTDPIPHLGGRVRIAPRLGRDGQVYMSDPRSPSGTVLAIADDGRHAVLWDGLDRVEWLREVMLVDTCDS